MGSLPELFTGVDSRNDDSDIFGRDICGIFREGNWAVCPRGAESNEEPEVSVEAIRGDGDISTLHRS